MSRRAIAGLVLAVVAAHLAAFAVVSRMRTLPKSRYNPPPNFGTKTTTWVDPATGTGIVRHPRIAPRDAGCAAKLKKHTLTNLYNERPVWLGLAHERMDAAVAAAYGWPADLSNDEILARLLELNLVRAAQEEIGRAHV